MKKLAPPLSVVEVDGEGLMAFLGNKIVIYCDTYIYGGILTGVNTDCVQLTNAAIIYETGPLTAPTWKDAQSLGPDPFYVMCKKIESFGTGK